MGDSKEDLVIKIKGDESDFKNSLKKSDKNVKKFTHSLKISASDIKKAFAVSFAGLTASAVVAFNKFKQFETGVVSVAKTTNLSGIELDKFKNNILKISETVPESTSKLLEIAAAAGQLGIKGVDDLTIFTDTIAKLGKTTNLAGEEAALSIARLLTITGESIGDVDKLGSVLVELGNNFAASEREIVRISSEVAKSTVNFGLRASEVAGLSTALAALGVRAELGGSSIGRAFRAIDKTVREGTGPAFDELKRLTGLTGKALIETFGENSIEVFEKFIGGLGRIGKNGENVTEKLALFNLKGEEILKVLPTLASRSELLGEALKKASEASKSSAALNAEAAQAFDTTGSKLQLAQNKLDGLLIRVGEELAPQVIESLNQMVEVVLQNADGFIFLAKVVTTQLKSISSNIRSFQNLITSFRGEEGRQLAESRRATDAQNEFFKQKLKERGLTEAQFQQIRLQQKRKEAKSIKSIDTKLANETQKIAIEDKKRKIAIVKANQKELVKIENDKLKRLLKLNLDRIELLRLEDEGAAEREIERKKEEIRRLEEIDTLRKTAENLRLKNSLSVIEKEQLKHTENLIKIFQMRFDKIQEEQTSFTKESIDEFTKYGDEVEKNFENDPIEITTTFRDSETGTDQLTNITIDEATIQRATINDLVVEGMTTTGGGFGGTGDDTTNSLHCRQLGLDFNSITEKCCGENQFFNGSGCENLKFSSTSTPSFSKIEESVFIPAGEQTQTTNTSTNNQSQQNNLPSTPHIVILDIILNDNAADIITAQQRFNTRLEI